FIAGEFQLNDGQFGLGFELAVGPDPVAQVEGLAGDLANLTRRIRRPGHSGELFGFAQLFFISAESHRVTARDTRRDSSRGRRLPGRFLGRLPALHGPSVCSALSY